jgi:hypothetical protein
VEEGLAHPEDCFSWWIEAHKAGPLNAAAVMKLVSELWKRYANRRIHCAMRTGAPEQTIINGVPIATAPLG